MKELALTLVEVLFWVAAVPAILFPLIYLRSPWKSTIIGKMMMAVGSALALVFVLSILFRSVPTFPGKLWLAVLAYGYLGVALWAQLIILLNVQRDRKRSAMTPVRAPIDGPAR